jgi:hypothetical protein
VTQGCLGREYVGCAVRYRCNIRQELVDFPAGADWSIVTLIDPRGRTRMSHP